MHTLCSLFPQGMPLMPQVTELMLAELLYLQYESITAPVFMYINSTGVAVRRGGPSETLAATCRLVKLDCEGWVPCWVGALC